MNGEQDKKKITIKPPEGATLVEEPKIQKIKVLPPKDAVILTETELLEKKKGKEISLLPSLKESISGLPSILMEKEPASSTRVDVNIHPLLDPASIAELPPLSVEEFEDIVSKKKIAETKDYTTINDYLTDKKAFKKELGLPDDINLNRKLREGEQELFDYKLESSDTYQARKRANESYFWGTVKAVNYGTASFFTSLDNATKIIEHTTGLKRSGWFKDIADTIEERAARLPDVPDTRIGRLLRNVGGLEGLFLELAITPSFKFKYIGSIPRLLTQMTGSGFVNRYADELDKNPESTKKFIEGVKGAGAGAKEAAILIALGYGSGKVAQSLLKSTGMPIVATTSRMGTTAVGFGGANAAEQLIVKGDIDWREVEEAFDIGLVFGIKDVADYAIKRTMGNYLTSSPKAEKTAKEIKIDAKELRDIAADLREKSKIEKNIKEKAGTEAAADAIDAIADIKIIAEEIGKKPEEWIEKIEKDVELSEREKGYYKIKIEETAADRDPKIVKASIIQSEIEDLKRQGEFWEKNEIIGEEIKSIKIENIESRIKEKKIEIDSILKEEILEKVSEKKEPEVKKEEYLEEEGYIKGRKEAGEKLLKSVEQTREKLAKGEEGEFVHKVRQWRDKILKEEPKLTEDFKEIVTKEDLDRFEKTIKKDLIETEQKLKKSKEVEDAITEREKPEGYKPEYRRISEEREEGPPSGRYSIRLRKETRGEVTKETKQEKEKKDFIRDYIDYILEPMPERSYFGREDLGLSKKEIFASIKNIKEGKETKQARKLIDRLEEFYDQGYVEMIRGAGMEIAKAREGMSIDQAKELIEEIKTGISSKDELVLREITEPLKDKIEKEGITLENIEQLKKDELRVMKDVFEFKETEIKETKDDYELIKEYLDYVKKERKPREGKVPEPIPKEKLLIEESKGLEERAEKERVRNELLSDLSEISKGSDPSKVGRKFAKLINKGIINLDENIDFVEKLKEKQETYRSKQDELLREKKDFDKSQIAEGLDDIMDAFSLKLSLTGGERIKARDGLQKVAKGLVDLSMTNIEQLKIKIHRWLRDNIYDKRKRRILLKLLNNDDLSKILKDTKFELTNKGLDDNIQILEKGLEDINFAIRIKKKEIIDVENKTQTINEFSKLIRDRRAWIDVRNFNAAYFSWELKKSLPKKIRELMPFIIEGTNIPDKLGRKDLQKLYKEEIDGFSKRYGDPLKKIESFYDVYWRDMIEHLDMMTESQIHDYVNRIWDVPKSKRVDVTNWFTTSTKHQKKRYIATLKEGIEKFDLKPRTTDIAELIPLYASSVNNAVANRTFVKALKLFHRNGQPMVLPASQAPTGWSLVDHPSLREWVFKGEKNGTTLMSFEALKVHPDLKRLMGIIFDKRISLEISIFGTDRDIIKGYEMTNTVFKKMWLTLSLFHHLALTETMLAKVSPKRIPKAFFTPFYYLFNPKKGSPAFENPELAGEALKYGMQLGASSDFNVHLIQRGLNTFAKRSEGVIGLEQFAKFVSKGNMVWDKALWDYLHDGFKLFAWEDVMMKVPKNYTPKQVEVWKGEQAQLINDTFGGQNWDVLMMSPKMSQMLGWSLLSMDWTISTLRQALGVTGFGKLDKSQKFWNQLGTKRSGARIRAKEAIKFWGRAVIYYSTLINLLNVWQRKKDEEENPQYYMDRELTFWDQTMLGNTVGHKTHLFAGRYEDGAERYVRWGKQFREMPELIIDRDGLSFPKPMLKKIGGKTAPMLQMTSKAFTGKSPSGYEDWDLKNKRGWDWTVGLMIVLGKGTLPFSASNFFRGDKEWKPTDLFYPSSKGMTKSKAIDLFKRGVDIANGELDYNYIIEIYEMAVLNNLPAFDLMRLGIASAKAEETIKIGENLNSIDAIDEAIRKEKNKETIIILKNKKNRLIKDIEGVKISIAYYDDIENYLREKEDLVIKQK